MLTRRQQERTHAEVSLRMGIDSLRGVWLLADGLHIAHAAVRLQGGIDKVVPRPFNDGHIAVALQQAVVHAPQHAIRKKCRTAGLWTWGIVLTKHRTTPIAAGTLHTRHTLGQFTEPLHEEPTVAVVLRHVAQHLGQSGQHPAVAARPEALAAVTDGLHFRVNVFRVTVVELLLRIVHQRVRPPEVVIQLVQILRVASHLVEFRQHGHHHVEGIGPPPEVRLRLPHFIVHHFEGARNLEG